MRHLCSSSAACWKQTLTEQIFTAINSVLAVKGLLLKEGTVVDATIIEAACSTKNRDSQRVPKAFSA